MKKLSILILAVVTVFTSCKKDDDNSTSVSESKLIGKWGLISESGITELTDCEKKSTIVFEAEAYTDTHYAPVNTDCQVDSEDKGTWKEEGSIVTFSYTIDGEAATDVTTVTITENTLTITYDNDKAFVYKKL